MAGEAVHHRRVEPQDGSAGALCRDQHGQHVAKRGLAGRLVPPMRHARTKRDDVLLRERVIFEIGPVVVAGDRLFEYVDASLPRKPAHEMLRALEDEIPPQMGETNQWCRIIIENVEGRSPLRQHIQNLQHGLLTLALASITAPVGRSSSRPMDASRQIGSSAEAEPLPFCRTGQHSLQTMHGMCPHPAGQNHIPRLHGRRGVDEVA